MLHRLVFACALVSLAGAGFSLRCRWLDHKFKQFSDTSLDLLEKMVNNATNSTEGDATEDIEVDFPHHLYRQASKESAENQVAFTVQVLKEVSALFEEDSSSASWQQITVEKFLGVVNRQADELHSCVSESLVHKKNRKLRMYFKRLLDHILNKQGYSAEAWETIRKETKAHLLRAQRLLSPLISSK
ncbi:interferon a3-like [Oryzias latipes]|uniref:CARD domain-containing protein n=1 Tax=Oryzias latipes TaxID=8090 RepID=A0A3B3IHW5_ORYLA|nr:interferon a3-like [Oryzias latipes]XP_023805566.1 interferon a3-like [Oryzias latipes]